MMASTVLKSKDRVQRRDKQVRYGELALVVLALAVSSVSHDVTAATIYECRAYNGSSFYSTGLCHAHKAAGVAMHTVPDGMPFDQQVKLIESANSRKATVAKNESDARNRSSQCAQIDDELTALQRKYTSWQYVPVNEVNVDQAKERDLKARRSSLQCYSK